MCCARVFPPIVEAATVGHSWRTWVGATATMVVLMIVAKVAGLLPIRTAPAIRRRCWRHLHRCVHAIEAVEQRAAWNLAVVVEGSQMPLATEPRLVTLIC